MTERDKKVLAVVAALVLLGGFWFLVVGKKRSAIAEAETSQVAAQQELDDAKNAETASKVLAKTKPVSYSRLVRLGKAIPETDDFQSLLVQVNDLTVDSNVAFVSLTTSAPTATSGDDSTVGPTGQTTTCDSGATESTDAAASTGATGATDAAAPAPSTGATGSTAKTWVGRDRDKANAAKETADASSSASENTTLDCNRAPTLTDLSAKAAGLTPINYSFNFRGSFYDLHSVYDSILGLVKVHNTRVRVSGRLLDINSISMSVSDFPMLEATVQMTGYRLPPDSSTLDTATAPAAAAAAATATANGAAPGGG